MTVAPQRPVIDDDWLRNTLQESLGLRVDAFHADGVDDPLGDLETYESVLYSLDKQDLILIVRLIQTLVTSVSPKRGLHTLVRKLTDALRVSHCSLIFLNLENNEGTVAVSHEDPDFRGVCISLDRYPEILRSLRTGEITIVKNPTQDPLMVSLQQDQMRKIMDVSIMVLPLAFQSRVFGTLLVRKQRSAEGFCIREVRICQLMVHVVLRVLQRMCRAARVPLPVGGVTAEDAGQESLEENHDVFPNSMMVSSVPVGVLVLDGEGGIRRANARASEILCISRDALLQMRYTQIVPEVWLEQIRGMRRQPGGTAGDMNRYHVPYTSPDGREKILSVEHDPVPGREPLTWVFFRDVSIEKEMEERLENQRQQLQEANERLLETRSELLTRCEDLRSTNERLEELNKVKTHFLAVATHEIRTPLSVIIGYNSFLLQERAGKVSLRQRGILQESVESGERLLGIVNEMLEFSRLETGQIQLRPKEGDIRLLLERVHRQMKMMADRAKLDLRLQMPDRPVQFPHDQDRISRVGNGRATGRARLV